jgi:hypothetical protein
LNFLGVRLVGSIKDLLQLTFNPEDSEKECKTDFMKKELPGVTFHDDKGIISILDYWKISVVI